MARARLKASTIASALDWAYDWAIEGAPGMDAADRLGEAYLQGEGTLEDRIGRLIRWQCAKAASAGFVTGLGGLLAIPLALPAHTASVLYIQVRMVAAIAHLAGHDVRDPRVKAVAFASLTGGSRTAVLKTVGIRAGSSLTSSAVRQISRAAYKRIRDTVAKRLLRRLGDKGMVRLGKALPVFGGFVTGATDAAATHAIGAMARDTFMSAASPPGAPIDPPSSDPAASGQPAPAPPSQRQPPGSP